MNEVFGVGVEVVGVQALTALALVIAFGPPIPGRTRARYASLIAVPMMGIILEAIFNPIMIGLAAIFLILPYLALSLLALLGLWLLHSAIDVSEYVPRFNSALRRATGSILIIQITSYCIFYILWTQGIWAFLWGSATSILISSVPMVAAGTLVLRQRIGPYPPLPRSNANPDTLAPGT